MENPHHTRIEQYLDGLLAPADRAAFEADIARDPALAAELRLHEAARAAVHLQSLLDRRDAFVQRGQEKLRWRRWWWKTLDVLERIFLQQRADGPARVRWSLVVAAGLSAALLLVLALRPDLLRPTPEAAPKPRAVPKEQAVVAFNTHFKRLDLSGTLGSGDQDAYAEARQRYANGDCAGAMPLLEALLADAQFAARPTALLLRGTCLLESGDAAAALETLRQVPPTAAGPYQEAEWYTALAYLKLENTQAASDLLQAIADNPKHRHRADAERVLQGQ